MPQVNAPKYQHTSILQEGQQAPQKEILIPFEQALQVRDVDQIEAHLKIGIDKFQGRCIKFCLYKWKELTSDMEVIGTVSGMPINNTSNLSIINRYQYPFNDKGDAFIGSEIQNLLKKES